MIERLLLNNVWSAIALGAMFYPANHLLWLYDLYLYHAGAKDFFVIPNRYDLNPERQAAITQRRWWTWKFAAILIARRSASGPLRQWNARSTRKTLAFSKSDLYREIVARWFIIR